MGEEQLSPIVCRCGHMIGRVRDDGRLKIEVRSRLVAVTKSGNVEMNCPVCKGNFVLPLVYDGGKRNV